MSTALFLKIAGITGESQDFSHKGWTDILSFEWGAIQPGSMHTGGGSGKVNFKDLSVIAFTDRATPALLKYCASGKHFSKAEISLCKAGGSQMEYSLITLHEDLIDHPEKVAREYSLAVRTACAYWNSKGLNRLADDDNFMVITHRINGGAERKAALQRIKNTAYLKGYYAPFLPSGKVFRMSINFLRYDINILNIITAGLTIFRTWWIFTGKIG